MYLLSRYQQLTTTKTGDTKMDDFRKWQNDADIPTQDSSGKWYDAETGFYYVALKSERVNADDKTKSARAIAKSAGGIALTGSAKQKKWGEQIRAAVLAVVTTADAQTLCRRNSVLRLAKFWIENRAKSAHEILSFATAQATLLELATKLQTDNKNDEYRIIAAQYNDLMSAWGF